MDILRGDRLLMMKTMQRSVAWSQGAARRSGALCTVLALLVAVPLAAQEVRTPQPPTPPGWIGVWVAPHYECAWGTEGKWKPCELVLHVDEVVPDGPAARAGVTVGDRLIALNGQTFAAETVSRMFSALRPGTPVSLDLRRDDRHQFVRVVPVPRPTAEPQRHTPARALTVTQRLPQAYVITSDALRTDGTTSLAFTIRRDGQEVHIVPSAIRVQDGELRVAPIEEDIEIGEIDLVEALPIQVDLGRELRAVWDSTYRVWLDKLVRLGERVAVGFTPGESVSVKLDGRRLRSVIEEAIGRHLAGAEFTSVRGRVARSLAGIDSGLLVQRVIPGTPAARLGLRTGDVVIEAGGEACTEVEDLRQVLTKGPEKGDVTVKWVRDGTTMAGVLSRP